MLPRGDRLTQCFIAQPCPAASDSQADTDWDVAAADVLIASPNWRSKETLIFSTPMTAIVPQEFLPW